MDDSPKGAVIFTFAIGLAILLGGYYVLEGGFAQGEPSASPTPPVSASPTPTPTAPPADRLVARLVTRSPDATIRLGDTASFTLTFRNTGTATWVKGTPSEARLGVRGDDASFSQQGMAVGWPFSTRAAVQEEEAVEPGKTATFSFSVKAVRAGTFRIPVGVLVEGVAWIDQDQVVTAFTVR
jgi:hypothetical protein